MGGHTRIPLKYQKLTSSSQEKSCYHCNLKRHLSSNPTCQDFQS
uniref:Uncharacterized protein n=1 Tax=Zea mays TaxID=4577 RepID=C4J8N0_MAIZE|nr:unknown [Zea mays]